MHRIRILIVVPLATACGLGVVGLSPSTLDEAVDASAAQDARADPTDSAVPVEGSASSSSSSSSGCTILSFVSSAHDFIEVPNHADFNQQGPITLEAWVRPTAAGLAGNMEVVSHRDDANNLGWTLLIKEKTLEFRIYGNGTQHVAGYGSGKAITPDVWTHVAGTFDGTTLRTFINGGLTGTASPPSTIATFGGPVRIGQSSYDESQWFDGDLAEVRVSKVALYTNPFTPPKPPLPVVPSSSVVLFRATGAAADVASDATGNHPGRLGLAGPGDAREPTVRTTTMCP